MHSTHSLQRFLLGLCLVASLATMGCTYHYVHTSNAVNQKHYKLTSSHHAAFAPGTTLDVDTLSGSISVTGTDEPDCHVSATITGYAPTMEEAQELAEKTTIQLNPVGQTFQVRADIPSTSDNRGVSVSYLVTVPRQANVTLHSAFGSVRIDTIEGTVNGKTNSGSIEATAIRGTTRIETSYGAITCVDVVGDDIFAHSTSGSINVMDVEGSAQFETSYGPVTCERFAGKTLTLKSGSGSVKISDSEAPTIDLSTSYGRVNVSNIITDDLRATSGSGSVDIVCSPACPADLIARVKSSYGSVTFTAPSTFAGHVTLSSGYGTVQTDLPVTVTGRIGDKKRIEGAVGQGNGKIDLQTGSGSVTLR